MSKKNSIMNIENINECIYFIRCHKVMLDQDLAILYGLETKRLNEQVLRNIDRFPEDFAFQLTKNEWESLRSQFATSKLNSLRFQFGTLKGRGGRRYLPYAFTEHGVAMLSSVLKSPQATKINIEIIRTFIKLRHALDIHKELSKEMMELKSFILKHSQENDQEFRKIWKIMEEFIIPDKNQRKIGFNLNQ